MVTSVDSTLTTGQMAIEDSQSKSLIRQSTDKNVDLSKVKDLSQQFESIFMGIVLKSMRSTVNKSGFIDGGNAEDIYRSMLDSEYAKMMSKQGTSGLAIAIERQLLENMGIKSEVGEISKSLTGRANYSSQALHPSGKKATIRGKS